MSRLTDTEKRELERLRRKEHEEKDTSSDFLLSAGIAAVTDSALLGAALGGDIGGAILGDLFNDSSSDSGFGSSLFD